MFLLRVLSFAQHLLLVRVLLRQGVSLLLMLALELGLFGSGSLLFDLLFAGELLRLPLILALDLCLLGRGGLLFRLLLVLVFLLPLHLLPFGLLLGVQLLLVLQMLPL